MQDKADAALARAVADGLPGVVAMATDRQGPIYAGAAGVRSLDDPEPMTLDTVLALRSLTKAVTATVCLQLVERGLLDLDAPAGTYLPEIDELPVIDGFDAKGAPVLRPPRTRITTRHLLLHTAGFGYDFFNPTYRRLTDDHGFPSIRTETRASLRTPLLHDPGTAWEYGVNFEWAGLVAEAIAGRTLGALMREGVFAPLSMTDTTLDPGPERRAHIHQRGRDGRLTVLPHHAPDREIEMGGGGLYGTVPDYLAFLRMWLNEGRGPDGPVLSPASVVLAARAKATPRALPSVKPAITNRAEFFPGLPKSWTLAFLRIEADAPTGRRAGSLSWAGLANLYYWIDPASGLAGLWATQLLPFADPAALAAAEAFERAIYA